MVESSALAKRLANTPLTESDFDAIHAAMMESARGRWFLTEYAQRNRNADTRVVLDAIERVATDLRGGPPPAPDNIRMQLMAMAAFSAKIKNDMTEIATGHSLDASSARARKIVNVLRDLDDQISLMLDAWDRGPNEAAEKAPRAEAPPSSAPRAILQLVETPPPAPAPVETPSPLTALEAVIEPEPEWGSDPHLPDWLLTPVDGHIEHAPAAEERAAPLAETSPPAVPVAIEAPAPQPQTADAMALALDDSERGFPENAGVDAAAASFEQELRLAFARVVSEPPAVAPVLLRAPEETQPPAVLPSEPATDESGLEDAPLSAFRKAFALPEKPPAPANSVVADESAPMAQASVSAAATDESAPMPADDGKSAARKPVVNDPFSAIMAMSEAERIALFS